MVGKKNNFGNLASGRHSVLKSHLCSLCYFLFEMEWVNEVTVLQAVKTFKLEPDCFYSQREFRDVEPGIHSFSTSRGEKRRIKFSTVKGRENKKIIKQSYITNLVYIIYNFMKFIYYNCSLKNSFCKYFYL